MSTQFVGRHSFGTLVYNPLKKTRVAVLRVSAIYVVNSWFTPGLPREINPAYFTSFSAPGALAPPWYFHHRLLVYCPESSRRYFGRLFADSFVEGCTVLSVI